MTQAPALYQWTLLALVAFGALSFILLFFVPAPYGRHWRRGWGPTLDARVAWLVMEAPSPVCFAWFFLSSPRAAELVPAIVGAFFLSHYLYRAFVYPLRMRAGSRQPWLTFGLAILFNVANGSLNGYALAELAPHLTPDWLSTPRFAFGAVLFVAGYALHLQSDGILRRLRRPGESGYRIPRGGLFRWVSCPNYLGEIVEWTGFALAAGTSAAAAFAFFTFANLFPRALSHHRWYRETFRDYPAERRALLPYLV